LPISRLRECLRKRLEVAAELWRRQNALENSSGHA
jgi:hypothetical protein